VERAAGRKPHAIELASVLPCSQADVRLHNRQCAPKMSFDRDGR
jgi:hypothetical protein